MDFYTSPNDRNTGRSASIFLSLIVVRVELFAKNSDRSSVTKNISWPVHHGYSSTKNNVRDWWSFQLSIRSANEAFFSPFPKSWPLIFVKFAGYRFELHHNISILS